MKRRVKLGVNIDHVATLRNARGGVYPSVLEAAKIVKSCKADGITMHLREDRRHIKDADIFEVKEKVNLPLNFEMAATDEMKKIALKVKPNACCIVPEKRQELTSEGGLDVENNFEHLKSFAKTLKKAGILTSLFINANLKHVDLAARIGADIVEFHTGLYCESTGAAQKRELEKIARAADHAERLGVICHAGHGLNYNTVPAIVKIPQITELNIGHFLIAQSIFDGLPKVIKDMQKLMKV